MTGYGQGDKRALFVAGGVVSKTLGWIWSPYGSLSKCYRGSFAGVQRPKREADVISIKCLRLVHSAVPWRACSLHGVVEKYGSSFMLIEYSLHLTTFCDAWPNTLFRNTDSGDPPTGKAACCSLLADISKIVSCLTARQVFVCKQVVFPDTFLQNTTH